MATQVQFRRGTTTETNLFTGAVGEVTVDTTKNVCVVHDGATSGGFPLLRQDGTNSSLSSGSLSSPSLKFSNSTTTGIYSPSPGSISIVNNGVANLTIDSSGAVNIPGNFLLSGNLSLPQGTVASPSLKIGPGTQGFYSPTTEQLAISIGSTQRALFATTAFTWGAPTGDCAIEIGTGATANRAAFLDFVGDTTYTDYGLRLVRYNTGPNANSQLVNRGTGGLYLSTAEAGPVIFQTAGLERARIDSLGRLLVGTSAARVFTSGVTPIAQFHSTGSDSSVGACRWSNDVNQPFFVLSKSRGATVGTQAPVASGDTIGTVVFTADDGTSFIQAARISALVDGTPGTNDMPGRLIFSTTPAGSVNPVERMRIDSAGNIGIGGAASAGLSFQNAKSLTGATTTYGQLNQGVVQSDCTSAAVYYASIASTQAAAFTLNNLYNFLAQQSTIGAGSTVTNQFGFAVLSNLTGATNNYGFYGNIPSGTGRWNFYAAGTADSYFASNNFIFANGGTERARFDSSGRLLVGTSTSTNTRNYLSADIGGPSLQIQGITQGSSALSSFCWSSTSNAPATLVLNKSISGAIGTRGALNAAGTDIGSITFNGDDGANFIPAAAILAAVDGTPGTNDMPGRLVFSTTADGASSATERMRISNAGTTTLTSAASTAPFIANIGASEVARIDSSGRLLVGTSAARSTFINGFITPIIQLEQTTIPTVLSITKNSADAGGPTILLGKTRGTANGSNTLVAAEDYLGEISFCGADGSQLPIAASIRALVDAAPGINDMPGRLVFYTTADGSANPTEQWRINNGGTVIYNQPAPAAVDVTATLTVANLTAKIITSSTAAAVTMTLPLGTSMDTGFAGLYTNMAFEWAVINTGATNAVTIQANTGHTIVGSATVAASNSGRFLCRRTAANTWVTYRLSS